MDIQNYISSGIVETYVMGLCSTDEKKEIEALRPQYPELDKAILEYENSLEHTLLSNATLPPKELDDKILQVFGQLQPTADRKAAKEFRMAKPNWYKYVAAAAVLLLIVSSAFNYTLYRENAEQAAVLQTKEQYSPLPMDDYNVLKQQTITPVAMYGVSTHSICRCTIFWDKAAGKAFVMIHHLPRVSGSNYQLWALVDGKPISVGIIDENIRDRFIQLDKVPLGASSFIVTLEKSGGTTTPTLEETYLSGSI